MDMQVTRSHFAKNIGTLIDAKINVYRNGVKIKVKFTDSIFYCIIINE